MTCKGAIFDVDGTLLDSMWIWDTIGEDYLRSLGIQPRENLKEVFKSMSLQQAAGYYQKEYGVALSVEEITEGVNGMIERYYREEVSLKVGAAEFLGSLNRRGVKLCIATATDRYLVEAALKRLCVGQYFREIFTCRSVGYGKDEAVIFERALSFLGTQKSETVVFEDALYAVRTAKAAGFRVIALQDRYERHSEEVKALADCYISDFHQAEEDLFS